MNGWPALHVLVQVGMLWLGLRLLCGRTTLSLRQLLLFGAFGAALGTVVLTIVQHWAFETIDPPSVYWAWVPAQEAVVVLALALLAAARWRRTRLSVVDYILVGGAVATGTATVQMVMQAIVHDAPASWYRPSFYVPIASALQVDEVELWYAGPILYGLFIGLAVGVGARIWPRRNAWIVTGLAGLAIALADHVTAVSRIGWELPVLKTIDTPTDVPDLSDGNALPDAIRAWTFDGRLLFVLVLLGLVLAGTVEAVVVSRRLRDTAPLMLPDEGRRPLVVIEWLVVGAALRHGLEGARALSRYFRLRRAFLLAVVTNPDGDDARQLAEELQTARAVSTSPPSGHGSRVRAFWPALVALLAVVAFIFVDYGPVGSGEDRGWTQDETFGNLLTVATVGILVYQGVRFRRGRTPNASDAPRNLDAPLGGWLLGAATACVVYAIYVQQSTTVTSNLYGDFSYVVPYYSGAGPIQTTLGEWTRWGGSPVVLISTVALIALACIPSPASTVDRAAATAVPSTSASDPGAPTGDAPPLRDEGRVGT